MTSDLDAVCVDALDPARLAHFWGRLLGREVVDDPRGGLAVLPAGPTAFRLRFLPTEEPKTGQNPLHLDLTSTSPEDQRATVARALALGGRHADVGQGPEEPHVVLADPEGDEFCVLEPRNAFLAGCGFVGALACDGSAEVGYFWSAALGWPLVWDQDQETAVQSPRGGPKITWGGSPPARRTGRVRLHLDVVPSAGTDQQAEAERLVSLGATRTSTAAGAAGRMVLADPDGNPFCLLAPA